MTGTNESSPSFSFLRNLLADTLRQGTAPSQGPAPDLARCAFFFDLDGTLAPIAPMPDAAAVPASTIALLQRLQRATQGAVAVVSGRALDTIDRMLQPLRLPAGGLHGAQWRAPDGRLWEASVDPDESARLRGALAAIAARHPGLYLENKGLSFAIHYRQAPGLEDRVREEVRAAAEPFSLRYALQYGKMVVEVRPRGADKARAIERFMTVDPFSRRMPIMAGDDLTDEPAFQAVNRLGGVSIKIGGGDTSALWRLADPAALALWLNGLLALASRGAGSRV